MGHSSENRVRLEDLLKLKRHEKPAPDFWEGFDRRLEQRRLQALISGSEPEPSRLVSPLKWAMWAAPVAAAVVLGMLFVRTSGPAESSEGSGALVETSHSAVLAEGDTAILRAAGISPRASAYASLAAGEISEPRFILDVLSNRAEELSFQRVLANPAMSAGSRSDARFVADRLSSRTGMTPVTFLVDRPRSRF